MNLKQLKCPICGDPSEVDYRPFCSRRCADVDLGRWLGGGYAIAGRDDDEDGATPDLEDQIEDEGSAQDGQGPRH